MRFLGIPHCLCDDARRPLRRGLQGVVVEIGVDHRGGEPFVSQLRLIEELRATNAAQEKTILELRAGNERLRETVETLNRTIETFKAEIRQLKKLPGNPDIKLGSDKGDGKGSGGKGLEGGRGSSGTLCQQPFDGEQAHTVHDPLRGPCMAAVVDAEAGQSGFLSYGLTGRYRAATT